MFKKDIDVVKELHGRLKFKGPLLDAGGLEDPVIADYDISAKKSVEITVEERKIRVPHPIQEDRYLKIHRPWSFIDPNYTIFNPEKNDGPNIEELPEKYPEFFNTVILVSVFEHVIDPFQISDALYKIIKPGGFLFNSTPFLFPYHPSPRDYYRYSPAALKYIHEKSGFNWLEGYFHVEHSSLEGIGDTNPRNYLAPQAVMACYALCRKNEGSP